MILDSSVGKRIELSDLLMKKWIAVALGDYHFHLTL